MKKLLTCLLALTLLVALALPVHADVIWEPFGDEFYEENREQFSFAEESAYANSPTGSLEIYDKPNGKVITTVPNGQIIYIQRVYTDKNTGQQWALMSHEYTQSWYAPLEYTLNKYDYEFFTDHEGEIMEQKPEGVTCRMAPGIQYAAYSYPNGPCHSRENYWEEDLTEGICDYYTDENGRHWGYIGYWYGRQDVWVCLDDPTNMELSQPEIYLGNPYWNTETGEAGPNPDVPQVAEPKPKTTVWYYLLPAAAVVAAAALLVLWPRKKKPE